MRCTFEGMLFVLLLCSHSPAGPAYSPEVTSFICYQAPLQLLQNVVANNGAGAGGYGVFADPDNRISFAYTPGADRMALILSLIMLTLHRQSRSCV